MAKMPDYFASFCLVQEDDLAMEIDAICALAQDCAKSLQFWEIVYVLGENHRAQIQAMASRLIAIKNLRVLLVNDAISYNRQRVIAASEAIGDVVVLTAFNEMTKTDVRAFAHEAFLSRRIVMGRVSGAGFFAPIAPRVLSYISRHKVDRRDLKTIAIPRNRLINILARPSASIDLRFEPKGTNDGYVRKLVMMTNSGRDVSIGQRLELLLDIISTSAARFLVAYALASLVVSLLAASYGFYAVAVMFILENVQPGWFSTAIAQSGSAAFLTLGLAVTALGIASIIERMDGVSDRPFIDELENLSFRDSIQDLNIEIPLDAREVDL